MNKLITVNVVGRHLRYNPEIGKVELVEWLKWVSPMGRFFKSIIREVIPTIEQLALLAKDRYNQLMLPSDQRKVNKYIVMGIKYDY